MRVCVCLLRPGKCWWFTLSSTNPLLSFLPLSRAWALNEAGGQRQCAANWPSLPGALAACDWSVQWGPTVQPPLHPALFHSNSQDARCSPVCLPLVSSTRGHSIFTYTPNTLSSFLSSCIIFTQQRVCRLRLLSESPVLRVTLFFSPYKHLSFRPHFSKLLCASPLFFVFFYC